MNIKPHIIFDKTILAKKIELQLKKKISNNSLHKSNIILVIGSDGFMLQSLKKYYKLEIL